MKITTIKNIEAVVHVLFWLFIFSAVNVNWASDWFDKTIRPRTPAPISVLLFPVIFYAHSLWALPKFLNRRKWKIYGLSFALIFIVPEFIRSGLLALSDPEIIFWKEVSSRDSLIFGEPNALWTAFIFSVLYRFTKDWFGKQFQIEHLGKQLSEHLKSKSAIIQPLNAKEASTLKQKLEDSLRQNQVYLNHELSLAELAKQINISDKKLSTLLNQNLDTNFYDYINSFRIATFKKEVSEGKLKHLSIAGLALQCGFKSKSSFYRAFKKETGMSPTQFIQ
jgi:AraC-like DNA-binding protein